jgi:hypothetical protein
MGLFDWLRPAPPLDATALALVERATAAVDPLIRQVPGHERRLAPALQHAQAYCTVIADRIPGPYEISRAAFAADPMVHALFGSADDIELMLAKSQCVREHLPAMAVATGQCCALLGMRHREKAGFGVALQGEMMRSDVPQKTLYFSDHTLAEPSPDLPAARLRLRDVLFDGLLKGFAAHVADVRAERDSLHRDHATVHACVRSRSSSGGDPETHTRRLAALEERLRATADALEPARLLDTLVETLAQPEAQLHLDPVSIRVDRSGVITGRGEAGPGEKAGDALHFAELTNRDQRRWVVILARIERDEARRAIERFEQANRYIVI